MLSKKKHADVKPIKHRDTAEKVHHKPTKKTKAPSIVLEIDNPRNRTETLNPERRAMIHDFGDKLTVNFGKDYPGGVHIEGKVLVPDELNAEKINVNNVCGKKAEFQHLLISPVLNNLFEDTLDKKEIFKIMEKLNVTMDNPDDIHKNPIDLASMLHNIQKGIKVLNAEIEDLKLELAFVKNHMNEPVM